MFPDDTIITVDDDIIYNNNLIESLVWMSGHFPGYVICNRGRGITYNEKGLMNYGEWPIQCNIAGHGVYGRGVGGILYPPHSLDKMVFDIILIKKYCPTTDDIWLKIMQTLAGTKAVSIWVPAIKSIRSANHHALSDHNNDNLNFSNFKALLSHFEIDENTFRDLTPVPKTIQKLFKSQSKPLNRFLKRKLTDD